MTITNNHSMKKAWTVVFCASLFFFYEFIQLNMFNSIDAQLMQKFHVDAAELGQLSSSYFIANVLFLLPAGMILDHFSTRKVILTTLAICILATYFFALSSSLSIATLCRFLAGIGSAFCFLSCIRLASRWLPSDKMALASGFIVTMAMLGGMVAQTPFTLLTISFGLQKALFADVGVGVLIFTVITLFVKDYPDCYQQQMQQNTETLGSLGLLKSMGKSYFKAQNWLCAIYTSLMNLPLFLLGALWGILYLTQVMHYSNTQASLITSMLFIGTTIGSPIVGAISDAIGNRKSLMYLGAVIELMLLSILVFIPNLGFTQLLLLFFGIGFISSTQIISYPTVTESNPVALTAMSVSVISITAIGGGAFSQPLFGKLMDLDWDHQVLNGVAKYSAHDFHHAMLMMPIAIVIALAAVIFIKETHCKRYDASED